MNKAPNNSKKELKMFLAFTLGFIVLFHCLFFWMIYSGKIFRLIQFTNRADFQVTNQYWKQVKKKQKYDSLFIGDEAFIKKIKPSEDCNCVYISVPYFQFTNIEEVLSLLRKDQFKHVFIENKAHFWTNFNNKDLSYYLMQNTDILYDHMKNKRIENIYTLSGEKMIFDLSRQLLAPIPTHLVLEEKYLEPLWFRSNPRGSSNIQKIMHRLPNTHFYWVSNMKYQFKSQTDLPQKLAGLAKNSQIDAGQFIDEQDIAQHMREP